MKSRYFYRSNDDYYVMNSGLVLMDTSLPQLVINPYDDVKSGPVPPYARAGCADV